MRKKWIVKEADAASVRAVAEALGVSELTAKVLYHRGIRNRLNLKE